MRQRRDKLNLEVERAMLKVESAEERIPKRSVGDDVLNKPCESNLSMPHIGLSDGGGEGRDRRPADLFIRSSQTNSKSSQVVSSVPGFSKPFSAHERVTNPNNHHVVIASPNETPSDAPNPNKNHVVLASPSETPSYAPNTNNNHVVLIPPNETSARAPDVNSGTRSCALNGVSAQHMECHPRFRMSTVTTWPSFHQMKHHHVHRK